MNHKIARRLYQATEAKYTAQIMDARARLSIYFESPVAIGEHPQHIEEMENMARSLAEAEDVLATLKRTFESSDESAPNE